jgi:dTDP-4-amino-4,6-dideoxygalactose transaminase
MSGHELELVREAFASNYIAPLGPMVDAFEEEVSRLTDIKYCLAVSSGTAAIHLALHCLGVGPGDEVFASTFTFIGSVSPILFLGATPVFIDCDQETWNMDPDLLQKELEHCARKGKLPKAVVLTDLYGQCADYDRIIDDVCSAYGVPVVVDAAEALGATYKGRHAGVGAKAAIFSFNGNKIITTSGGGILASDDKDLIEHACKLSQQAREPFPHYEHHEVGYNYRMSNILAAIGLGQLRVLNERVQRKREIFNYYVQALKDLPGITFMPEADYGRCNRWLTVILIDPEKFGVDRERVRLALEENNIEARPVWKPMHLQPAFKSKIKSRVVGGEVSERLFKYGLCLPSGTAMTENDLERVVQIVRGLKC